MRSDDLDLHVRADRGPVDVPPEADGSVWPPFGCRAYATAFARRLRELPLLPRALRFSLAAKKASAKSRIAARSRNEPYFSDSSTAHQFAPARVQGSSRSASFHTSIWAKVRVACSRSTL